MSQKIKQDISIGSNIRSLRKKAHLTQEQVVAYLQLSGSELSRSSYSQIECGTYNIRVSELNMLKKLFKCDYNAFFINTDM
ncbi:MAG: helix-turn-helix transcriptional regulator [Lachnospiraceae bacterium]|nr:helix-turn-helix transcriptional regulator [Lachnospiraceae bacterium]